LRLRIRAVEHITGSSSGIPIKDFVVKTKQEHEDIIIRVFDYLIDSGVNVDGLHGAARLPSVEFRFAADDLLALPLS
jgi:hypothetical protein